MDNLLTYSNLRRDNCTGEVCFKGRWYTEEEYLELQNDMGHDEYNYDCAMEDRAELRAEDEQQEESWAA